MPLIPRRIGALLLLCGACLAQAERLQVAVAANFKEPLQRLVAEFDRATGHETQLSLGATGALYARISHGAPYDVFLSADTLRVQRLELDGVAVAGTRFTYATGRLALWSARADGVDAQGEVLKRGNFKRLALASPQLAPYGAAAVQVLAALGVRESAAHPWIRGESIGQTYAFVASGNVDLGLVALSQVMENGRIKSGSAWIVPASLHPPMRQDAVLLAHGKNNRAARALLAYLRTPLAWWLARTRSWLKGPASAVVALPLVLPPTVLGFYLLLTLGPNGPLGHLTQSLGLGLLPFTFSALVLGSVLYSLPFVVQPLQNAFEAIGERPLEVAASLRASPLDAFFSVALPLARPGYLTACVMGFAHTLGEFGVVLMLGGNIPGQTRVLSVQIFDHVEALEYAQAHGLAAGMLVFSFVVLLTLYALNPTGRRK